MKIFVFESTIRKKWTVAQALHEAAWIGKMKLEATFTWEYLAQFVEL
jgi:hypothetical protein